VPSIIDGLFAGRAGIQSHGIAISVLADNISNANTTGFKTSRPDFADLVAGAISGGRGGSPGSGSNTLGITQVFNQGTFEFTGRSLDLGIDGNGFFIVQNTDGSNEYRYTRAGNFSVDATGNLLNQNGFQVLGFPVNGAGGLEPLNVNNISQESVATVNVNISGNLNAAATGAGVPAGAPTFAQLSDAAQYSTFVTVFDSLGAQHDVTVFFFKNPAPAVNQWTARAYVDAGEVGGVAGDPALIGSATIGFDGSGARLTDPAFDFQTNITWGNGSQAGVMNFKFSPFTQYSASSSISGVSQDGTGGGSVTSFSVEKDGRVIASLDNGQDAVIGTIGISTFANPEALRRAGGSLFAETAETGEPVFGTPDSGVFGGIQSGALELSTTDIAADFIKLISLQRGFQGSSRIITSIDQLLNEIINLAG
jgi:flagellar hook protein FlgE